MNDKKGKAWGYFITGKSSTTPQKVESDLKKPKFQKEKVEEKLAEALIEKELLDEYKSDPKQIILVDLLGRLVWMNSEFRTYTFKNENDLMERICDYGYEVYSDCLDQVLEKLPENHSFPDFDFQRVESKGDKPFGYFVTFKTLVQVPENKTRLEMADEILKRAGLTVELLQERYNHYNSCIVVISMTGRFIWFNKFHSVLTKRDFEKDFMVNGVNDLITSNQHNIFLVDNVRAFMEIKEESFQFSSEVVIKNGGKGVGKYNFKRVDSEEGIPLFYFVEIQVLSLEKEK